MNLHELEAKSRDTWEEYFLSQGAVIKKNTTKTTDLVIVGLNPGETKITKARSYGVPTVTWGMFVSLGWMEKRGPYKLNGIPEDLTKQVLLLITTYAELSYAQAITTRDAGAFRCYQRAAAGVDLLLRAAYGDPLRDPEESLEGSDGDPKHTT
jgi:hypothetical protein